MAKHRIRKILDLSMSHLPLEFREPGLLTGESGDIPSCIVTRHEYGLWLWVPDDPVDSNCQDDPVPPAVLEIQLLARKLGCDYVLFDADGELDADLPVFEEGEGGPPYDAATATGMYDHD